ncbi:hypothetical protein LZK76_36640 (plasmid) [Rhizobium leguminosarum]|nr:hypothetical protein LZK76_36640 [Rhizobium leguminosarum]
MVSRGLSESYGFWNTICTRRRNAVSASPLSKPNILTVQADCTAARGVQANDRPGKRALAGAAFADDANCFAGIDLKIYAVESAEGIAASEIVEQTLPEGKRHREVFDVEQRSCLIWIDRHAIILAARLGIDQ